jgi:RimJ/RimL family protein N-acetyltransferase
VNVINREIRTERLALRPHTLEDFTASAALWGDPLVTRYIGGKPSTPEEVWSRVLRYIGHWTALGYGFWAVLEKETGRFVGEAGIADFKRDMTPAIDAPEVGWAFAPSAQGKGYATEAVRAALAWGETHLGARRTMCIIAPDNEPSIRVAVKCGFQELARTTYKDAPTIVYQRQTAAPALAGELSSEARLREPASR